MEETPRNRPLHTRSLTIIATQADETHWRVRGDVIDLRKCSFVPMIADLQPAGIIHQMTIDVRVDTQTRRLESLETQQPFVAIESNRETDGECCRDPAPRLQSLVGEAFDDRFLGRLTETFGGPRGCSHLLTLFRLMASTIPRALDCEAALQTRRNAPRKAGENLFRRSAFIDGTLTEDDRIGLTVQLADFHAHADALVDHPLERLAEQTEVLARTVIRFPANRLETLQAMRRTRSWESLGTATWTDESARFAPLAGSLIIPGLARALRQIAGGPNDAVLLDALLQLAPGYIQVLAAVTERWFARDKQADPSNTEGPAVATVGGMPDSCYMWRKEGPLTRGRLGPPPAATP